MLVNLTKKRNRSRTDIIADILTTSLEGVKKTHLMYSCYLSFDQLTKYLDLLIESKMIVYEIKGKIFKTTSKGKEYLATYDKIKL